MRYVAVLLAVLVVATAAAAQEWNGAESAAPGPIELRPSEPPAETPATLLDLKASPTTPSAGASDVTPAAPQRTTTQRPATGGATTPRALPPSRPRAQPAQPARSVGAAPAPAAAPVPIQQTRDDDDGGDDDDSDGDSGGDHD